MPYKCKNNQINHIFFLNETIKITFRKKIINILDKIILILYLLMCYLSNTLFIKVNAYAYII